MRLALSKKQPICVIGIGNVAADAQGNDELGRLSLASWRHLQSSLVGSQTVGRPSADLRDFAPPATQDYEAGQGDCSQRSGR